MQRLIQIMVLSIFPALLLLADTDTSDLQISGFGSIGAIYNHDSNYLYRPDLTSLNGSDGSLDLKTESLLGLQADYEINEQLDIGLQGVIKAGDENDPDESAKLDSSLEWLYLKYTPLPKLEFRVGRLRFPAYYHSESYNIGYTYPWAHLPTEIYTQVPFSSYDGIDLRYHDVYKKWFYSIHGLYGYSDGNFKVYDSADFELDFDHIWGIVLSAGTDSLQLRLNYMQGKADVRSTPYQLLFDALSQTPYKSYADWLSFDDKTGRYYGFGLSYHLDRLEILGEISKTDMDSAFHNYDSWFLHAGYQFDTFLPYIAYAEVRLDDNDKIDSNPIPNGGTLTPLHDAFGQVVDFADVSRHTWMLGVRFEVSDNMALKFQYDRILMESVDSGFVVPQSTDADGDLSVYSAALHFVF